MAPIKINRIISVNNEDPKHPAINLLNTGGTGSWKCKSCEDKKAILILELSESSVINSIDIGNENSAFIEILVAKSADPDHYQVLIIATLLMSLQESRSGINKNGVKFFKSDQLHKPVADESWDRVKIICSQPFVNNAQFGLAFITFHSKTEVSDKTANKCINLGKFRLKAADDSDINVGSVFQKRNDPLSLSGTAVSLTSLHSLIPGRLSVNNKIKNSLKSTTNNDLNDKKKRKIDTSQTNVLTSNRKATGGPLLYDDSDDLSVMNQSNNDSSTSSKKKKRSDVNNGPSKSSTISTNNQSSAGSGSNINLSTFNKRNSLTADNKRRIVQNEPKRKPFNKLFENVIFVFSGYQNPYRAELRSKALQMGAKYKADWDGTCTHLICAFMNTPKYHQVRGSGRIVRKDWIEDSYNQRKRLPWKVYALNKNDVNDFESDEEILEQTQDQQVGNRDVEQIDENEENQREITCVENDSGDSDTEGELDRVRNRQKNDLKTNIYDAETDVEDESEDVNEKNEETESPTDSKNSGPSNVPTFFEYIQFYLDENLPKRTKKKLQQFIELHNGNLTNNIGEAHYVVSEVMKSNKDESYKIVKPQWILEFNVVLAT